MSAFFQASASFFGQTCPPELSPPVRVQPDSGNLHVSQRSEYGVQGRKQMPGLPDHDREALVHYYHDNAAPEDIQAALGLTPTQFREIKARARAQWVALCGGPSSPKPAACETPVPFAGMPFA